MAATVELVVTEPRDVYKAMLDLIESSHWSRNSLACPVYAKKRMRVLAPLFGDQATKSGYRYQLMEDTEKGPIKFTYCLVGLLLRVVFPEDYKMSGEIPEGKALSASFLEEGVFTMKVPNSLQLLKGLWKEIPDEYWNPEYYDYRPTGHVAQSTMINDLEAWNDTTDKHDVTNLIRRAYDAAAAA